MRIKVRVERVRANGHTSMAVNYGRRSAKQQRNTKERQAAKRLCRMTGRPADEAGY
jgi:hypothetical protein